ncbi:unnamed protein product [Paramecium pentaurelia]|uniref:Dynein heavy chain n=1 Tax=Paramecium pentaurelia TaxID=43138 RepID=A0A8S1RWW7_9CILI|nr:unnamed protein product [Paramecium pentaurelia]
MNQTLRSPQRKLDGPIVKLRMRKILDISKIRKEEEQFQCMLDSYEIDQSVSFQDRTFYNRTFRSTSRSIKKMEDKKISEEYTLYGFSRIKTDRTPLLLISRKQKRIQPTIDEDKDVSNQEWFEKCKQMDPPQAKAQFYDKVTNSYIWYDVIVLDYVQETKKFSVQKYPEGQTKNVTRLSIKFYNQNQDLFQQAQKEKIQFRSQRKIELKKIQDIINVNDVEVNKLPETLRFRFIRKFYQKDRYGLLSKLLEEVNQIYTFDMKKCVFYKDLQKYKQVYCPLPKFQFYQKFQQQIENNQSFMQQITIQVWQVMNQRCLKFNFQIIDLNELQLPIVNTVFQEYCQKNIKSYIYQINLQRKYKKSEIQDVLQKKYNFLVKDQNAYHQSPLHRILRRLDLVYADFLKHQLMINTETIFNIYQKFILKPNDTYYVNTSTFLVLELHVKVLKQTKSKKQVAKKMERLTKQSFREKEQEIQKEEIEYDEEISINLSETEIIELLTFPQQQLIEQISRVNKMEGDIMTLLLLKNELVLTPTDIEYQIQQIEPTIEFIKVEYNKCKQELIKFKKFEFILKKFRTAEVNELLGIHTKRVPLSQLNFDDIDEKIKSLEQAKKEIIKISFDSVKLGLFTLKLKGIKEFLINRAEEQKKMIMNRIHEVILFNIKNIGEQYEEAYKKGSHIPDTEQELIDLKLMLDEINVQFGKLRFEISQIMKYVNIFEDNYFEYDNKIIESYYHLLYKPKDITQIIHSNKDVIQVKEKEFLKRLKQDEQDFKETMFEIAELFNQIKQFNDYSQIKTYLPQVNQLTRSFNYAKDQISSFNIRQQMLSMQLTNQAELDNIIFQFKPYEKLWTLVSKFESQKEKWISGSFKSLNYQDMIWKINQFASEIGSMSANFEGENENLINLLKGFRKALDSLKDILWVVEALAIEAFTKKPQFWRELFRECKISNFDPKDDFPFFVLLNRGILNYKEQVIQISIRAEKGWNIEKRLQEMHDKLSQVVLEVSPYRETFIFKNLDEIQVVLDEQFSVLTILKAQPHIKLSVGQANQLEYKILLVQDTLDFGMKCQKQWMYLDPIFSSEDIQTKLVEETKNFKFVDQAFRNCMKEFKKEPILWECVDSDKMKVDFSNGVLLLDQIQKSLTIYLEQKRIVFPRFYFVSDEELVQILSQTKDPTQIQNHIYKCFEAMHKLQFSVTNAITGFQSTQEEKIQLFQDVKVMEGTRKGNVELWLLDLQNEMRTAIKNYSYQTWLDLISTKQEFIAKWPAQCILLANHIRWTRNTESAIRGQQKLNLGIFCEQLNKELHETVQLVRKENRLIPKTILEAMVVMEVHAKDIVQSLYKQNVQTIFEFAWISQLRYYNEENKNVSARMINVSVQYGFEYLGKVTRLVMTSLTDRCQRTLLEALHMNYGGAPEGPAGTGKSETVKDLAKAIGMPCIVFNCSDGLNYIAMGKFFKGLASSGSWCCFDEFNRIDAEVLSVVAQQIYTIQKAIKEERTNFIFEGENVQLIRTCAINVTMNPGYAGRTELPDNLKILFRPCAMMVPDYAMIAEIYLYSIGFQKARELSSKIVTCLKLCNEQLSSQEHYDFGMRTLKAVLNSAKSMFHETEEEICLNALINVNKPKFTDSDLLLFMAITQDLFPGIQLAEGEELSNLYDGCQELDLQMDKEFFEKCSQLNNNINVRNGVMCIGQACAGKTSVLQTLSKSQDALILKLNPKSITSDQLYGKLDPETKQWSDGVAPILIRDNIDKSQKVWIMFDGPVDSIWIENLNTVLDDNKKLCLTSGEILKIPDTMCMLFEIEDLKAASPATVSRCGMVYFLPINWYLIVQSIQLPKGFDKDYTIRRIRFFLDNTIAWVKSKHHVFIIYDSINILTCSFLKLLSKYLTIDLASKNNDNLIIFCLIWSFGAAMDEQVRPQFNLFLNNLLETKISNLQTQFPADQELELQVEILDDYFQYCFNEGKWIKWIDSQPPQKIQVSMQFHEIFAQTTDTIRNDYFCQIGLHFLFAGPTGTGKSLSMNKYQQFLITCSGQTTSNRLQRLIETKINKRRKKGHFYAEEGQIRIFVDDLNMPYREPEGSVPAVELLRQWMEMNGWYDLDTKEFKYICDITFLGAIHPQERNQISLRYLRFFNLLYIGGFNQQSLTTMLNVFGEWLIMNQVEEIRDLKNKLVEKTINLYSSVQKLLLPTPQKSHYIYNLRDIFKIFEGISKVKVIENQAHLFKLWAHECLRVFSDRLIDEDDQNKFEQLIQESLIKLGLESIQTQNLVFSSCLNKQYEEVYDLSKLREKLIMILDKFNTLDSQSRLQLIFFDMAIIHIIRIVRILSNVYGHVLMIGMGGTGRSSLSKIANFIVFNKSLKTIDSRSWNEQLLIQLKETGLENDQNTILFNDSQFQSEYMLEDVCNLMSHGEVSHLFPPEERIKIQETTTYSQFVKNCKLNIHVILCMQPVGGLYRKRLRTFPTIINCTTIDWFSTWPQDALESTAEQFLPKQLVKMAVEVHYKILQITERFKQELRRYFYVTPTQYLQMLQTFQIIQEQKMGQSQVFIEKFENGVEQIKKAENDVDRIKAKLFELQPKLQKANEENNQLLIKIQKRQEEADRKKQACEFEEKICLKQSEEANELRNSCQQALDNVLPLLAQATEALERITKDDMILLKSFTNPPISAAIVMEGLAYAFEEDHLVKSKNKEPPVLQDYWDYAKKCLLNDKLIKRIKSLKLEQIRQISFKNIQKLQVFAKNPLFEKDRVFNASKAAGNLALWIRAVLESYMAVEIIEPKKAELKQAEEKLSQAEELVQEKKNALEVVLEELHNYQLEYNRAKAEKERIEEQVITISSQLQRAEHLIANLSEEKSRWKLKAQQYKENQKNIIGDCMLNSAIIAYLGVFPIQYREICLEYWKSKLQEYNIQISSNYSLQNQLSDPVQINKWLQQKLPNDQFSIDNAIIMKQSSRWPLMIDPQLQANEWIKNMENQKSLIIFNAMWPINQIQLQLQHAIQIGYAVLLENAGQTLDPLYEQILQFNQQRGQRNLYIKFGDKMIEYSSDFRFYITTKLSNPHYQPQVCVVVTMLNFQVTQEGLIDQMLNIVVKIDEPLKDEQRNKNISQYVINKNKQIQTENLILKLLSEASGDLLENEVLIKTLQQSKDDASEIELRLQKLEHDQLLFNQIKSFYNQVGELVSNIYFIVNDLSIIEPTYLWSLEFYIQQYQRSIKEAQSGKQRRVQNIIEKFLHHIYTTINRSLLDKDKFIFRFLFCLKVLNIPIEQIRTCVIGPSITQTELKIPKNYDWLTPKMWLGLVDLMEKYPQDFGWLCKDIEENHQFWDGYFYNQQSYKIQIPQIVNQFNYLMLIKIIKPEQFINSFNELVRTLMGKQFLENIPFTFEQFYQESTPTTPLLCLIQPGSDARQEIISLADKLGYQDHIYTVSLGQGQIQLALKLIKNGLHQGKWVLLQNCHVAQSFMPELEQLFENQFKSQNINKEFRLWLTSQPTNLFPHNVLLKTLKLTYELPRGLKNNMLRSYFQQDQEKFEQCKKQEEWKNLFFSLTLFHACILERRKYGPLGWNVSYNFSQHDLEISKEQILYILNHQHDIQWDALQYLVAESNYGGRVTDPQDRKLLNILVHEFLNENTAKEGYVFSDYVKIPESNNINGYINYIQTLPIDDPPQLFGLHSNAEIYSSILLVDQISQEILQVLPRAVGAQQNTDFIAKQKCKEIIDLLPQQFNLLELEQNYPILSQNSLNTVLQQDVGRYNKLLRTINSSLSNLIKQIDGYINMSDDSQDILGNIMDNKVPNEWLKHSYQTTKPLATYIKDLLDRLSFIRKWIIQGEPILYWLGGLFFIQSFLTGILQNYARKHKIPIDEVKFDYEFYQNKPKQKPEDGFYVEGIYIDGAKFDFKTNSIEEPENLILYYDSPVIHFKPTLEQQILQHYACPLYNTVQRRGNVTSTGGSANFICNIKVPIRQSDSHWTKRGVAMILQLN